MQAFSNTDGGMMNACRNVKTYAMVKLVKSTNLLYMLAQLQSLETTLQTTCYASMFNPNLPDYNTITQLHIDFQLFDNAFYMTLVH